jgi:hypothetical protein
MAKKNKNMKKGKAHHWSVPDDQKVAKKVLNKNCKKVFLMF